MIAALKGTTNLCRVLPVAEFSSSIASRYILDGEQPLFVLSSVADDYLFSNLALVHLDGEGPVGKKRAARRFTWKEYIVSNVILNTAGVTDQDVELLFVVRSRDGTNRRDYSIDVKKAEVSQAIWLYKALVTISEAQMEGERSKERLYKALSTTIATGVVSASGDPVSAFRAFAEDLHAADRMNALADFSWAFNRYTHFEGPARQ